MAKKPKHTTIEHLIQYTISLYYVQRERDPGLKADLEKNIEVANRIEAEYHKELLKKYPEWDTEENRRRVRSNINYLTGIYTKYEALLNKKERLKQLHQAGKEDMKRISSIYSE